MARAWASPTFQSWSWAQCRKTEAAGYFHASFAGIWSSPECESAGCLCIYAVHAMTRLIHEQPRVGAVFRVQFAPLAESAACYCSLHVVQ